MWRVDGRADWLRIAEAAYAPVLDEERWSDAVAASFAQAVGASVGVPLVFRWDSAGLVLPTEPAVLPRSEIEWRLQVAGDVSTMLVALGRRANAAPRALAMLRHPECADALYLLASDGYDRFAALVVPSRQVVRVGGPSLVRLRRAACVLANAMSLRTLGRWDLIDRELSYCLARRAAGERSAIEALDVLAACGPDMLNIREHQIASMAMRGMSNKEIGYELGIATATAGVQLARAMAKLSFTNRVELCSATEAHAKVRVGALSPAERAVLQDARAGRSTRDIASARRTSVRTIANQLAAAYRKLGVHSRTELPRA